ncbi:putative leucine-rich repeat receptor-like serine/threonine-protein [Sesbania bispinosa]|nr:putative leucine-rich repeat receptor-like serine/threonine-protein [Sesbania bispinosa]
MNLSSPHFFFILLLVTSCFASLAFGATLSQDEVQALKDIGKTLGKNWDFGVDPCSGERNWRSSVSENAVHCNCSFVNGTICHVTNISLTEG